MLAGTRGITYERPESHGRRGELGFESRRSVWTKAADRPAVVADNRNQRSITLIDALFQFSRRRSALLFWLGSGTVSIGVLLHLPMFWMARSNGFVIAGMPMDSGMVLGMALIVGGILAAGYGLLPDRAPLTGVLEPVGPPEDLPLTRAHWRLIAVLSMALIIDVMKPASLGFVTPGMRVEYGIDGTTVALLPLSALIGTAVGSFAWGALADVYGRRASILVSSVMFVGTSICGAMPSFSWNIAMCFLMGAAAGGMLPVA